MKECVYEHNLELAIAEYDGLSKEGKVESVAASDIFRLFEYGGIKAVHAAYKAGYMMAMNPEKFRLESLETERIPAMNSRRLKERMIEHGFTCETIAQKLGISTTAMRNKLYGRSEFTQSEIGKLSAVLMMMDKDIREIFFDEDEEEETNVIEMKYYQE